MTKILDASARIMYEAAQKRGIECQLFDDKNLILMTYQGNQWYVRGSRTSVQSSVGRTIADQKSLTKQVLHFHNLPTAKSCAISSIDELETVSSLTFPLVIKPNNGAHGLDVKVGLQSKTEIAAFLTQHSSKKQTWILEEQLVGKEFRILCVDFKFVAAAYRHPAHVIGDGTHTITELVTKKNQHPWRGRGHEANLTLIEIDETVISNLTEQNLTPDSIPKLEQEIRLRKTANLSTGGEAWNVSDEVCPENRALFAKIAQACDLNTIGIDVMCQSLSEPITKQPKAGIIEVNASPGLRMHHYPIKGEPVDAANKILDMVLTKLNQSQKSSGI